MTLYRLEITDRSALQVCGPESETFLQSILSNDMTGLTPGQSVFSLLLTPQGKVVFDLIIWRTEDGYIIEVEKSRSAELEKKFKLYKLRADVDISLKDLSVTCLWGDIPESLARDLPFDPRHKGLGLRVPDLDIFASLNFDDVSETATEGIYKKHRIAHKVPQGSDEIPQDQAFPLEYGLHELTAIDFQKGCYVGQEVTARMKHKTTLKKGLARVRLEGAAQTGAEIVTEAGKPAGRLGTVSGDQALAYLRFDRATGPLFAEGTALFAEGLPACE